MTAVRIGQGNSCRTTIDAANSSFWDVVKGVRVNPLIRVPGGKIRVDESTAKDQYAEFIHDNKNNKIAAQDDLESLDDRSTFHSFLFIC